MLSLAVWHEERHWHGLDPELTLLLVDSSVEIPGAGIGIGLAFSI